MSCDNRHQHTIRTLLSLAGLNRVDADTLTRVARGVRHHHRHARSQSSVHLDKEVQAVLALVGHDGQLPPAWVDTLINLLNTEQRRGNRHAMLTLRWLTSGFAGVTPLLTDTDRAWILAIKQAHIPIPETWETYLDIRPAAVVGQFLPGSTRDAFAWIRLLEALGTIDSIPDELIQSVTHRQVVRVLCNVPFVSHTDIQRVARAIVADTPVVRDAVAWLKKMSMPTTYTLMCDILRRKSDEHRQSIEQAGTYGIRTKIGHWLYRIDDTHVHRDIDIDTLDNPSPEMIWRIMQRIRCGRVVYPANLTYPELSALLHLWQMNGRDDAVAQVIQVLVQSITSDSSLPIEMSKNDTLDDDIAHVMSSDFIAPMVTNAIAPPHGDAIVSLFRTITPRYDSWPAITACAVYAASCQRMGYVPRIDGIEDTIRNRWCLDGDSEYDNPSPLPVLAIGRERELLLPALTAARRSPAWIGMVVDCINTIDMLFAVDGNPRNLQDMITEVIAKEGDNLDHRIVIRLAASRHGQDILYQATTLGTVPIGIDTDTCLADTRVIRHLVSPWWDMAPQYLREWAEHALGVVAQSPDADILSDPPPIYATVWPWAAVKYPTRVLVERAIANPSWERLPVADRLACLHTVFQQESPATIADIAIRATTETARRDIATVIGEIPILRASQRDLQWFLDLDT